MATSYQATEWNTGDTITKDKMNKIEKGIETNSKEFGNYATRMELSDYIPNSAKGVSVATLENGKIPMSQIPDSDTGQTISGYVKNVTSDGNATLTITTDSSPHNIKINNVKNAVNAEVATKATQDSEGNIIKDTYVMKDTTMNVKTLSEPLDDWHNLTIGVYNVTEDVVDYFFDTNTKNKPTNKRTGLLIVTGSGNRKLIEWYPQYYNGNPVDPKCIKFNIGGSGYSNWISEKAPLWNIAFTEQTNNTPPVNDNSKKIADTAFVKSQSASMQVSTLNDTLSNYWVKEPSGLITQFVEVEATTEEIEVPLPLAFSHKCLFVDVDVLNQEKDTLMDVKFNTIEKGLNSVKLLKIGTGTPKITVRVQGV